MEKYITIPSTFLSELNHGFQTICIYVTCATFYPSNQNKKTKPLFLDLFFSYDTFKTSTSWFYYWFYLCLPHIFLFFDFALELVVDHESKEAVPLY